MADRKRPRSVMVKLNNQTRHLQNARVIGPVSLRKYTWKGHLQVEITGIEIDGFGAQNDRGNLDISASP